MVERPSKHHSVLSGIEDSYHNRTAFYNLDEGTIAEFFLCTPEELQKKLSFFLFANILGVGKSTVAAPWMQRFKEGFARHGLNVGVYYDDFRRKVGLTKDVYPNSEVAKSELGGIPDAGYGRIARVERFYDELVIRYIPKPALVVKEGILVTQNFDRNWSPFGSPRGDIAHLRGLLRRGFTVRTAFILMDEVKRHENIAFRVLSRILPPGQLRAALKQAGKTVDTDNVEILRNHYQFVNEEVAMQQFRCVVSIMQWFMQKNIIIAPDLEYLPLEELVRFMWDNPSVFESFLQKYIITRLIDGIYERDEDRKLAAALYNSTLEGGVPIEEYPGYLDEHSVTTVLKNVADDSGNPGLLRGLRALKLL